LAPLAGILLSMSPAGSRTPQRQNPTVDELLIADEPERWSALGFTVEDGCSQLGSVRLRFIGRGSRRGIVGWSLRAIASVDLDGLPTTRSQTPVPVVAPAHPNGVVAVDHIVAMSPALDRSVRALRAAGLPLRRIREEPTPAGAPRQAFFRLGGEILEVIQQPRSVVDEHRRGDAPARLWGLALIVEDLDRAVGRLGPDIGPAHPAVQPGRRIASLRRSAGLAIPVALMSSRSASSARGQHQE
jgi:hypothetical protein